MSGKKDASGKWKKIRKSVLILALPLFFFVKALVGTIKALRGGKELEGEEIPRLKPMPRYHKQKRVVQTGSGIPIKASVFVPNGEGPFPAVIMVHSWMWWRMQCDLLYAPLFARNGYVVLTYDCRGWGSSGGEVACAAPDRELCDLEDMITWLTDPASGIPVDPERIGITGVSYGGGHSFLIASRDERIKAAAPMNGWTDLNASLMPNNCWKAVWSLALFAGSLWAVKFDPRNDLVRWLRAVLNERDLNSVRGELNERSVVGLHDKVRCPIFVVHSWNDDLFEPNQILDFYSKLDVPKRLYMANGIHGLDAGRGEFIFPNEIWKEALRWFDYWLKGEKDNGIAGEPEVKFYCPWNGSMETASKWPPENIDEMVLYFRAGCQSFRDGGRLDAEPPQEREPSDLLINNTAFNLHSSGMPMLRTKVFRWGPLPTVPFSVRGDSALFAGDAFDQDRVILGAPSVRVFAASSTTECQINVFLYDVSPRGIARLVTHGCFMKSDMTPGEVREFEFDLIACAHMFRKGHRPSVMLTASDPLFVMPSRIPSRYRVYHTKEYPSSVTLPVLS